MGDGTDIFCMTRGVHDQWQFWHMSSKWARDGTVNAAWITKTAPNCLLSAEFLNFDIDTELNYIVESASLAIVVLSNFKKAIC